MKDITNTPGGRPPSDEQNSEELESDLMSIFKGAYPAPTPPPPTDTSRVRINNIILRLEDSQG